MPKVDQSIARDQDELVQGAACSDMLAYLCRLEGQQDTQVAIGTAIGFLAGIAAFLQETQGVKKAYNTMQHAADTAAAPRLMGSQS
jgi:hypothetical protein